MVKRKEGEQDKCGEGEEEEVRMMKDGGLSAKGEGTTEHEGWL